MGWEAGLCLSSLLWPPSKGVREGMGLMRLLGCQTRRIARLLMYRLVGMMWEVWIQALVLGKLGTVTVPPPVRTERLTERVWMLGKITQGRVGLLTKR